MVEEIIQNAEAVAENTEAVTENTETVAENTEAVAENAEAVAEKAEAVSEAPAEKQPVSEEEAEKQILKNDAELMEMRMAEVRRNMASMSDNDIKNKTNQLRSAIERDEKALRNVFRELKNHRADTEDLKKQRDELNGKVRELSAVAQKSRAARDEINAKIAELKKERATVLADSKARSGAIVEMKAKRDEFNAVSKGTCESLTERYQADLKSFTEADMPLDREKEIFERLMKYPERMNAAKEANELHKKIQETYDNAKDVYARNDELSAEIKKLSEESQKHHLEMIEGYRKVDEMRKEADDCHRRLTEKYTLTKPITAKIDPLKKSIAANRMELDVYLERSKAVQEAKDEKRLDRNHDSAKEKLEKNGRLTLEDLSVLIEKGDIKFNK
ncbi:phosphoserine phosphatase [Methanosarcinaceae archaeon]|nr:phosphoserine phosphatase [Methanosarcinaceae archaeon]